MILIIPIILFNDKRNPIKIFKKNIVQCITPGKNSSSMTYNFSMVAHNESFNSRKSLFPTTVRYYLEKKGNKKDPEIIFDKDFRLSFGCTLPSL